MAKKRFKDLTKKDNQYLTQVYYDDGIFKRTKTKRRYWFQN